MQIGFIGLGRMGGNMAVRLLRAGHTVFGADPSPSSRELAESEGVKSAETVAELARLMDESPRVFWAMVPAGAVTETVINDIASVASPGDIIVDGGNSNYKDSRRRGQELEAKGLRFLDCGTSGGVWGLKNGYCLMLGGPADAYKHIEPMLLDLAQPEGCLHCGNAGAGHYAKMIHNGIEYGMLQSYAEGFELLYSASEFDFDLHKLAHLWNHGSVIRSWLLELAESMFAEGQDFEDIRDDVADSGEGRWTVMESIDRAVPAPVITLSLQMRFRSRQDESYAGRTIASLRKQFGGHATTAAEREEAQGRAMPSGGEKDI